MTTDSGKIGTEKMNGRAYANDLATRIAAEMRRQSKAREIVHMSDEVCLSLALQAAERELTAMTARCEKADARADFSDKCSEQYKKVSEEIGEELRKSRIAFVRELKLRDDIIAKIGEIIHEVNK